MVRVSSVSIVCALVILGSRSSDAFVVAPNSRSSRSSFLGQQQQQQQSAVVATLPKVSYGSGMALHMNLFDRFQRVAKANLNNVLQNLEDPEKIMTQALEDMQVSK